jgi:hypothetical protein
MGAVATSIMTTMCQKRTEWDRYIIHHHAKQKANNKTQKNNTPNTEEPKQDKKLARPVSADQFTGI